MCSLPGGIAKTIKLSVLLLKFLNKFLAGEFILKSSYKSVSSDYLGIISKYEKDKEMSAVEKSCFMTSQSKTDIKPSKLFELANLNIRHIFLFFVLKLYEIGQFARVTSGLFHVGHIQHFSFRSSSVLFRSSSERTYSGAMTCGVVGLWPTHQFN